MSLLSNPRFLNGIEGKLISVKELDGKYLLLSSESTAWKYDQEEGVIVETWFTKSFQKITHGLISDEKGGYSLVLNESRVLSWDAQSKKNVSLDALEPQLTLRSSPPVDHFLCEDKELFWVQRDGGIVSDRHVGKSILPPRSRVGQVKYLGGQRILFLYEEENGGFYAHFQALFADEDPGSPTVHLRSTGEPKALGTHITSCVFIPSQNQIVLLLSDKLLVSALGHSSSSKEQQIINLPPSYSLSGASIAPLGEAHFVLTCKSPEDGYALFLFNAAFGDPLILTHLNIKTVTAPLRTAGSNIFIQHGPRVAFVRVQTLPQSLAELIAVKDNVLETKEEELNDDEYSKADPMKLYELILPMLREGHVEAIHKTLLSDSLPEDDVPELLILAILEVYFAFKERFSSQESFKDSVLHAMNISLTPNLMAPLLKKTEFAFAKDLLQFFHILMEDGSVPCKNLICWASLLLDAHYLNFQLSRDEEGLGLLSRIKETLSLYIDSEELLLSTLPLLKLIRAKKVIVPRESFDRKNSSYFIDVIEL